MRGKQKEKIERTRRKGVNSKKEDKKQRRRTVDTGRKQYECWRDVSHRIKARQGNEPRNRTMRQASRKSVNTLYVQETSLNSTDKINTKQN